MAACLLPMNYPTACVDGSRVLTSATAPAIAEAAAVSGLASNVRLPGPCLPSKFRLLVLIQYCPGFSSSPLIATHMLQPGSLHSAPASKKTRSSPSLSADRLTDWEPGTTMTLNLGGIVRPFTIPAAARRSESREFVQLPM